MSELTANWVRVGDARTFQTVPTCPSSWPLDSTELRTAPAPFGGPVLVVREGGLVSIYEAGGREMSVWRWKSGKIISCDWSLDETAVFVTQDGTVLAYDLFGKMLRSFGMGREAKDLKIASAKVFRSKWTTGVAVLTTAKRFFVVNNIEDPRVRKLQDFEFNGQAKDVIWCVLTDEKHAKIALASEQNTVMTLSSHAKEPETLLSVNNSPSSKIVSLTPSYDGGSLAVLLDNGCLWLKVKNSRATSHQLDLTPDKLAWCAKDCVVAISSAMCQMHILTVNGDVEQLYLSECICVAQEMDGARIFASDGQQIVQEVPRCLLDTFAIGSVAPAAMLYAAAEEYSQMSHKADEYLREIRDQVGPAVDACVECAGHVRDVALQKELLKAAQFGKYFLSSSSTGLQTTSADSFTNTCLSLRILNTLRSSQVGIPLTYSQYSFLTPQVVLDRLLARRLYPLALEMGKLLKMTVEDGENRVLAHWACFKVGQENVSNNDNEDLAIAREISRRLGHNPKISYSDIAAKAADCGRKNLAIKILDHESRVSKQVPLLVQLGQESTALSKAINSGDRDLAFSVLLHLKAEMSPSDFHMIIRKYPLGRTLYHNYCRQLGDSDSLEEWFMQEDDFVALAKSSFEQAMSTHRYEARMAGLLRVQEYWQKSKQESLQAFTEEHLKLLRHQSGLEDKTSCSLVGRTVNETLTELLMMDQPKLAEKLKGEMKVSDRRFAWLRVKVMVKKRQWDDLKKFARQKRPPLPASQVIRYVREQAGDERVKEFLTEEFVSNSSERVNLLMDFGMFVEAANAAFTAKSIDSLNALESVCAGRDDMIRMISNFKAKLLTK